MGVKGTFKVTSIKGIGVSKIEVETNCTKVDKWERDLIGNGLRYPPLGHLCRLSRGRRGDTLFDFPCRSSSPNIANSFKRIVDATAKDSIPFTDTCREEAARRFLWRYQKRWNYTHRSQDRYFVSVLIERLSGVANKRPRPAIWLNDP